MSKDKTEVTAPLPGGKASGGKKGLVIGLVVVLLAAAGGGGAYWKFVMVPAALAASAESDATSHDTAEPKTEKAKAGEMPEDPGLVPFEPFLVNLADEGSQSYLRVTLSLLVESEEEAKALEAKPVTLTRIRSSLLEVLATQTAVQLSTPEGKTELKQAIKERIETLNLEIEVYDVLFSDFVVQY